MTDSRIELLFLNQRFLPLLDVEGLLKPSWEVAVVVCLTELH